MWWLSDLQQNQEKQDERLAQTKANVFLVFHTDSDSDRLRQLPDLFQSPREVRDVCNRAQGGVGESTVVGKVPIIPAGVC